MNKVSVIILNWNRKFDVGRTIKHLNSQTVKPWEIIVVDNASSDGSREYIKRHFPSVKNVILSKNHALAGFNYGMEFATGDLFVLLASDSIPERHLIEKHIKKFKINSNLGVCCPSTYDWDTKEYLAPNRAIKGNNRTGYEVTYFDGNGICINKEAFQKVGGYSSDYFICLEELEWAVRILLAGYEIKCFTDLIVYNSHSQKGNKRNHYGFYYARNWIWFYAKYLPLSEIFNFLILHFKSFKIKTDHQYGSMNKVSVIGGLVSGIVLSAKFISQRRVLPKWIIERVKLDLFPNSKHLYTK